MKILDLVGFSVYEKKIIEALMYLERSDARKISQKSKVPYNKVYQILQRLIELNLVLEFKTKPKEYILINIENFFKERVLKEQKNLYELEDEYEKFLKDYKTVKQSEEFWVLSDTDTLLKKIEDTYELLKYGSNAVIEKWIARYSTLKKVKKSIELGQEIRFLGNILNSDPEIVKKWLNIGVKIKHNSNISDAGFAIFDKKSSKISIGNEGLHSIWCENEALATILDNYFEVLWQQSENVTLDNLKKFY